jgi:hypothetical protein
MSNPKYRLEVSLSSHIEWAAEKKAKIADFKINFDGKVKQFSASPDDLVLLREKLTFKIWFGPFEQFYLPG